MHIIPAFNSGVYVAHLNHLVLFVVQHVAVPRKASEKAEKGNDTDKRSCLSRFRCRRKSSVASEKGAVLD